MPPNLKKCLCVTYAFHAGIHLLFSKYGEISNIYVDESKLFAFVEFISSIDELRALNHTNKKIANGRV